MTISTLKMGLDILGKYVNINEQIFFTGYDEIIVNVEVNELSEIDLHNLTQLGFCVGTDDNGKFLYFLC